MVWKQYSIILTSKILVSCEVCVKFHDHKGGGIKKKSVLILKPFSNFEIFLVFDLLVVKSIGHNLDSGGSGVDLTSGLSKQGPCDLSLHPLDRFRRQG